MEDLVYIALQDENEYLRELVDELHGHVRFSSWTAAFLLCTTVWLLVALFAC